VFPSSLWEFLFWLPYEKNKYEVSMLDAREDGITHINVYSKGNTALGRFLSNFAHSPITTEDGPFESIEGYWYWLATRNKSLRNLYGFAAKKLGKECPKVIHLEEAEFKRRIIQAINIKVRNNPAMYQELLACKLPLAHYYVFGGAVKDAGYKWILDAIDDIRREGSVSTPHLFTAQYRYPGKDRLDITVKGNCPAGKLYAPTWEMVQGVKTNNFTEEEYTKFYYDLLLERWKTHGHEMLKLVEIVQGTANMPARDVTLVCFCPAGSFCHRHLLVKFLQHNWAVEYGGERTF
jgi:hypothetical protein